MVERCAMQQLAVWKRQAVYALHNLLERGKEFFIILNLVPAAWKAITHIPLSPLFLADSTYCTARFCQMYLFALFFLAKLHWFQGYFFLE